MALTNAQANAQDSPGSIGAPLSTYNAPGTDPRYLPGGLWNRALLAYSNMSPPQVLGANTALAVDPQAAAYYGDQIDRINNQLGTLNPQLQAGKQNVQNTYNDQNNQLSLTEGQGTRDYNTNRANTITDEQTAKGNIDTGVRQNNTALLRLLGSAGSGDSSAAQILAPYAAARAGSVQRGQVQTTYGRNLQGLDTNYGDFQQNIGISRADLAKQRDDQLNTLTSGIDQTRAKLLDTLAGLVTQQGQAGGKTYTDAYAGAQPYVSQADSLIRGLVDLSKQYQNPALAAKPVAYNAPSLDAYNFDNTGAPAAGGGQPVYADQLSPYSLLFNKKQPNALGIA